MFKIKFIKIVKFIYKYKHKVQIFKNYKKKGINLNLKIFKNLLKFNSS